MTGIKYISLLEPSGYGEAGRRYIKALVNSGVPLTWCPLVPGRGWNLWYEPFRGSSVEDPEIGHLCNKSIEYDTVIAHVVPEYFPLCKREGSGSRFIGNTVWETTEIPAHWPELLNSADALLVPSAWNAQVFRDFGVTVPISEVPHIACNPVMPISADLQVCSGIGPNDFVFYSIAVWTERKANQLTLRAYLEAFTADDPVALILKTSADAIGYPSGFFDRRILRRRYQSSRAQLDAILADYPNPARVLLVTEELSSAQIGSLHARGNCYVSLCRSEGWGIGAFDASAYGNPVIMTGFGGQLTYLGECNSLLVDFELVPVIDSNKSYTPNQRWAEPRIAHAAALMRSVFEQPESFRAAAEELQKKVLSTFSERAVASVFIDALVGAQAPLA